MILRINLLMLNLKSVTIFLFKERFGTIITSPAKTIGIVFLATVLITTGIVGARNISEKYF